MAASSAGQQASSLAPGLARKVKKVLEIKSEAPELVEALTTLSALYHDNTPASRRTLRSTVERRGLEISDTFLTAAEAVIQALEAVSSNLDGLSISCDRISTTLAAAKASTEQLSRESERLQGEVDATDLKARTIATFLNQYQVTEEEVAALQTEDATDGFFSALAHVQQIYDNCRGLMRTQHQRAGAELMDQMLRYRETAYERLCRWIQVECRSIGDMEAPAVSGQLQRAVAALRDRPELYKLCVEEVATARHNALFQRFIGALTRGGPGGMPRPIELHAHDPQRYVNDMLAWVHQALEDEREFVTALFTSARADDGPPSNQADRDAPSSDADGATAPILDRIFDSICRPLRVRVEQVLMTSLAPLPCLQLAQLHAFYLGLVLRVLGPAAQLVAVLRACRDMAQRIFADGMRAKADRLVRNPPPPPKDLSAPPQVAEAVQAMLEVVAASESAMPARGATTAGGAGGAAGGLPDELAPVLGMLLDALMEACARSAESLSPDAPSRVDDGRGGGPGQLMRPSARETYLINCLSTAGAALAAQRAAAEAAGTLAGATEQHVRVLVEAEVRAVLARGGCADILDRLQLYAQQSAGGRAGGGRQSPQGTPASDPSLSHARIVDALRALFMLLSSPDALPEFQQIQVPRVRTAVANQFAAGLADAYEALYTALEDPRNGYLDFGGAAAVRNSPQQVRTVLGIS